MSASLPNPSRAPQALALLLAFACAASAGYWALTLAQPDRPLPTGVDAGSGPDPDRLAAGATALFGAQPQAASRFRLWGVIGGAGGAALIGVDGGAPKAYAVGAELAPGVVLRTADFSGVALTSGDQRVELKLTPATSGDAANPGPTPPMPPR